jgi:metacaspase-1
VKKALCVGVNYAGTPYQLTGAVNDALAWSNLLRLNGFDVEVLLEAKSTRQTILEGIAKLVGSIEPGDTGFFVFAGHGTWVPDCDGDEPDRRDEALVPFDVSADGRNLILDDELRDPLTLLPPASHLVTVTDCCHSGTVFRMANFAFSARRVRFVPPAQFAQSTTALNQVQRVFGQGALVSNAALPGVLHFAACKDYEYAHEDKINGQAGGAFSHFAMLAMSQVAARGGSYSDAFKLIRQYLPNYEFQQTPQLVGPRTLKRIKVFG